MKRNEFYDIRQQAGLSQKAFAEAIGVGKVWDWENGRHMANENSLKKLIAYCIVKKINCEMMQELWKTRAEQNGEEGNPFLMIRLASGMTREEFAQMLGVKTVSNWESGRCVPNYKSMNRLVAVCEELGIDYSKAQEAWMARNRESSFNKRKGQRRRWKLDSERRAKVE